MTLYADSTVHTWKPTVSVDPTATDAPYSSYAATATQLTDDGSASKVVALSGCAATKTCPGVYENAFGDLGEFLRDPVKLPRRWCVLIIYCCTERVAARTFCRYQCSYVGPDYLCRPHLGGRAVLQLRNRWRDAASYRGCLEQLCPWALRQCPERSR